MPLGNMKLLSKPISLTLLCLAALLPLVAQSRHPHFYAGVTAGASATILHYTDLHDHHQKLTPSYFAGLGLEWRPVSKLSLGLDIAYSRRNTSLEFNTPYLLDFSTTAITNISYTISASGLEARLPLAWHFGSPDSWPHAYGRLHAFAGPFLFLPLTGSIGWTRTHLNDGQVIDSYLLPLSSSSHYPYDYGVMAGFGVACRLGANQSHWLVMARLTLCYGLSDTFSDKEKNLAVGHFYGLGDIQHETLGERYIRQVSLSVTIALPMKSRPPDACWIVDN